jgi:hypothetical protein
VLLEAIPYKGADAEQLSELGTWAMGELEKTLVEGDVRTEPMRALAETGLPPELPQFIYKLTPQGAEKIGLDPNTLV